MVAIGVLPEKKRRSSMEMKMSMATELVGNDTLSKALFKLRWQGVAAAHK